ncbi:MAG: protein kinase, partial [Myxococcota bacterium]
GEALDVVHRDISPANVVVTYNGGVKVVDFGIAKARGRLTKTETETIKGKMSYMSPEQLDGGALDRRSDIFALGIVLWECLAVKRLFRREHPSAAVKAIIFDPVDPPSSIRPEVSEALDEITMRALEKKPDDRYQTAQEMQLALEASGLPGAVELAQYVKLLFGERMEQRQQLLKRLVAGERLDSSEVEAVTEGFNMSDSDSVSMPSMRLRGRTGETASVESVMNAAEAAGGVAEPTVEVPEPGATSSRAGLWKLFVGFGIGAAATVAAIVVVSMRTEAWEPRAAAPETLAADEGVEMPADESLETAVAEPKSPPPADESLETAAAEPKSPSPEGEPAAAEPGEKPVADSKALTRKKKRASLRAKKPKPQKKRDPAKAKQHADIGTRQFMAGRLSEAEEMFKRALAADSQYAKAHRGLGMVYESK